jgi:hypothetical protein
MGKVDELEHNSNILVTLIEFTPLSLLLIFPTDRELEYFGLVENQTRTLTTLILPLINLAFLRWLGAAVEHPSGAGGINVEGLKE